MSLIPDPLYRVLDLLFGEYFVILVQLLRNIIFITLQQILDALIILDHLDVHVGDAEPQYIVLVLWIFNLGDSIVQYVVPHLMIKIVVRSFV